MSYRGTPAFHDAFEAASPSFRAAVIYLAFSPDIYLSQEIFRHGNHELDSFRSRFHISFPPNDKERFILQEELWNTEYFNSSSFCLLSERLSDLMLEYFLKSRQIELERKRDIPCGCPGSLEALNDRESRPRSVLTIYGTTGQRSLYRLEAKGATVSVSVSNTWRKCFEDDLCHHGQDIPFSDPDIYPVIRMIYFPFRLLAEPLPTTSNLDRRTSLWSSKRRIHTIIDIWDFLSRYLYHYRASPFKEAVGAHMTPEQSELVSQAIKDAFETGNHFAQQCLSAVFGGVLDDDNDEILSVLGFARLCDMAAARRDDESMRNLFLGNWWPTSGSNPAYFPFLAPQIGDWLEGFDRRAMDRQYPMSRIRYVQYIRYVRDEMTRNMDVDAPTFSNWMAQNHPDDPPTPEPEAKKVRTERRDTRVRRDRWADGDPGRSSR